MMGKTNTQRGFTIVELLIVIVVIGILAAITIVAFNNMRSRASASLVQSELSNTAKAMEADKAVNDRYASTPTAANEGKGVPIGKTTTYQYRSTATTYCITATNGGISYMISETSTTPTAGGCPSDPINGEIANLAINPSIENDMAWWGATAGAAISRVTTGVGIVSGVAALEVALGTANQSGARYSIGNLQTGTTYTVSANVTLVSGDGSVLVIRVGDGSGTRAWTGISSSLVVNQPVRVTMTWQSSPTNPNGGIHFWRNGTAAAAGVIRIDSFMITQGSSVYNYADGATPGWIWNGATHNSTSKGAAV